MGEKMNLNGANSLFYAATDGGAPDTGAGDLCATMTGGRDFAGPHLFCPAEKIHFNAIY